MTTKDRLQKIRKHIELAKAAAKDVSEKHGQGTKEAELANKAEQALLEIEQTIQEAFANEKDKSQ